MKTTFNDYFIAYLTLFSGLAISSVAIYYSVMGLIAIYPTAVIPIVIMGITIELGKLAATLWLKQNWNTSPWFIKVYILPAIILLMLITSLGVFGFLSKAHSDQNLVSGDVQSKIAIYDEKIRTAKENIDVDRKAIKQMDDAVDQVMGRSTSETGADKAVAIRRGQQKERARLAQDIEAEQKKINQLMEDRAPIAAEVRKVEAEVGPIKYIAAFVYSATDQTILEKAVTWVTLLIVIVLDPMAVILLLASQYSFSQMRNKEEVKEYDFDNAISTPAYPPDDGPLTESQVEQIKESAPTISTGTSTVSYLFGDEVHDIEPDNIDKEEYQVIDKLPVEELAPEKLKLQNYVQNEEQGESNLWTNTINGHVLNTATGEVISQEEYIKIAENKLKGTHEG